MVRVVHSFWSRCAFHFGRRVYHLRRWKSPWSYSVPKLLGSQHHLVANKYVWFKKKRSLTTPFVTPFVKLLALSSLWGKHYVQIGPPRTKNAPCLKIRSISTAHGQLDFNRLSLWKFWWHGMAWHFLSRNFLEKVTARNLIIHGEASVSPDEQFGAASDALQMGYVLCHYVHISLLFDKSLSLIKPPRML